MRNEVVMLGILKRKLEEEYNELYDAMYHYIWAWFIKDSLNTNKSSMDIILYRDEIENLIGIREHDDIVSYVLNNILEG